MAFPFFSDLAAKFRSLGLSPEALGGSAAQRVLGFVHFLSTRLDLCAARVDCRAAWVCMLTWQAPCRGLCRQLRSWEEGQWVAALHSPSLPWTGSGPCDQLLPKLSFWDWENAVPAPWEWSPYIPGL